MTRLERFRAFMARMNPTAEPVVALRDGLYVEHPNRSIWSTLQKQLELNPDSSHLVLGGIGSGKTSELMRAARALRSNLHTVGDVAKYCDVSQHHHLEAPARPNVLVALVGRDLRLSGPRVTESSPPKLREATESLRRLATTHVVERYEHPEPEPPDDEPPDDEPPDEDPHIYHEVVPGVLVPPPGPVLTWSARQYAPHLKELLQHYPGVDKHAVFLFDSLDRLPRPEDFIKLVQDDLRTLKAAGIGVVVVGPIRYIVGNERAFAELFDHTHFQLSVDPQRETGLAFLCDVLRRRAASSGLLPEECLAPLALASGGVLRDLLKISKRAGEEAYTAGREQVTPDDVATARDAEGRSLAIGLDEDELKELRKVHTTGKFVIRGARELSLLETRRVLMYEGHRWAVHPALAPLLDLIPEAS